MPRNPFWTSADAALALTVISYDEPYSIFLIPAYGELWDREGFEGGGLGYSDTLDFVQIALIAGNIYDFMALGDFQMDIEIYDNSGYLLLSSDGYDSYPFDSIDSFVAEYTGTYWVSVSYQNGSFDGTWTLGAFETRISFFGDDYGNLLFGNSYNNVIIGYGGNDVLDGRSGSDRLIGGQGNDSYITDGGDTITESAGQGTDTVQSSVTLTLGANLENLILTGSGSINGTGNSGDNRLTGNSGNNVLNGAGGSDVMLGAAGNDIYVVDGGDTITENAGQGTDTVQSSVALILAANMENLILTGSGSINGTGNSGVNRLTGNSGNNVLNGAGGSDAMLGAAGNDTYVIDGGDTVTENAGQGKDTVKSSVTITIGANIENLVLTGAGALKGTGNSLGNTMTGNSGANLLSGGTGKDVLTGGGGKDSFVFDTKLGSSNIDKIKDFNLVADTIRLENAVFKGLASGTLRDSAFSSDNSGRATDSQDRVIYEQDTGKLYFDRDGTGGAVRVHFTTLDKRLDLDNSDFLVF